MRFANKTALVTGSSRGIGRELAILLAKEGAEVIIHYFRNKEEAGHVLREIEDLGGKAHLLSADISDAAQAKLLAEQSWELTGGIDILINNAGISYKKHFLDCTPEDVSAFIDTNLKGALFITQCIAKRMVAAQIKGSIYTMTSINGIQPGVGLSVYGAAKGGLETLMKGVALELAPHQINVNTIVLGAIATDMNASLLQDPDKLNLVTSNIPLGRIGNTKEVASVVCNLIADGQYITGASIKIDGGWLLKHGYENPGKYNNQL